MKACIHDSMSYYIVNFHILPLYSFKFYHNFDAMLPDEHEAMIRPSTFKFGFSIFTIIHPRIPPIKKVNPMLIGINHL